MVVKEKSGLSGKTYFKEQDFFADFQCIFFGSECITTIFVVVRNHYTG